MIIGDNKFRIPQIYCFDMSSKDGIQMLLGCNFLRSLNGGVRIEGNMITFYKEITPVYTTPDLEILAKQAAEEELNYDLYTSLQPEWAYKNIDVNPFLEKFQSLLQRLKNNGYIGDDPIKHWSKNQVTCKLDIINPDLTIQDKPLKHVTPLMQKQFKRHIEELLKLKVIKPSTSRHRTMAMIVNSGTSIDPVTGTEVKGKERMVFNYRSVNDNTYKDQYSLPGINTLLKKIGNSKIYSKFDLKSGFHQVAMHPDSIEWTAFISPTGLYEWLVMPFGLKNAPAVFQQKMDKCFANCTDFLVVYIDDILIFSNTEAEHKKHLEAFLKIVEQEGLILSANKMKIAEKQIEFLGAVIGNNKIKLQPHIIK
ncbi:hypothetical protein KFK09_019784 [Dendrobium nobile]|uniref:Reverse transcriptase domain-containing protein n=1 Tax=Dendrobium nobile TaxID=94219 RepID=A0A8T3AQG6_DENNO|nr:hypothetical protein KFK09_019784 [Dendrobium nobile]